MNASQSTKNPQNIAIVGAGILGLLNAYTLTKAGHKVTIYDKSGFPASNASSVAGGMLAPYSEIEHMTPPYLRASLECVDMWKSISEDLELSIDYHKNGSLFIAHPEDQYTLQRFIAHLPPETQIRHIEAAEMKELEPQLSERFSRGMLLTEEGHLCPKQTLDAIIDYLRKNGATLIVQEQTPSALTEDFDIVADCRGYDAWEDDPELRGIKGETVVVENSDFKLSRPVRLMHPRYPLYILPREDNIFMIGATNIETANDWDDRLLLRSAMELMSALYSLHPSFGDAKIVDLLSGIRPAYNDNLPKLIPMNKQLITCNGSHRHGYLLSPAMAKGVLKWIENPQSNSIFPEQNFDIEDAA